MLLIYITHINVRMSPDVRAEGMSEASGRVPGLWRLSGLPESSGSAVWRLQGRAAGSRGQTSKSLLLFLIIKMKTVEQTINDVLLYCFNFQSPNNLVILWTAPCIFGTQ